MEPDNIYDDTSPREPHLGPLYTQNLSLVPPPHGKPASKLPRSTAPHPADQPNTALHLGHAAHTPQLLSLCFANIRSGQHPWPPYALPRSPLLQRTRHHRSELARSRTPLHPSASCLGRRLYTRSAQRHFGTVDPASPHIMSPPPPWSPMPMPWPPSPTATATPGPTSCTPSTTSSSPRSRV